MVSIECDLIAGHYLLIPGADDEQRGYRLELMRVRPWLCLLTRIDTGDAYEVEQVSERAWRCDCKDHGCRKAPRGEQCKHISGMKCLQRPLADLRAMVERHRQETTR